MKPIPQQFEVIKCRTDVTTSVRLLEALMENVAAGCELETRQKRRLLLSNAPTVLLT